VAVLDSFRCGTKPSRAAGDVPIGIAVILGRTVVLSRCSVLAATEPIADSGAALPAV
jgi:hypothetical protein